MSTASCGAGGRYSSHGALRAEHVWSPAAWPALPASPAPFAWHSTGLGESVEALTARFGEPYSDSRVDGEGSEQFYTLNFWSEEGVSAWSVELSQGRVVGAEAWSR